MFELNLQYFGGRGSGSSLTIGSGQSINIKNETDVWSYRHNPDNEPFVDMINTSVARMQEDFKDIMETVYHVNAAELGGADKMQTLGFYSPNGGGVSLNKYYTNVAAMNAAYDEAIKAQYHPARGSKSGVEAVAFHEMGHALTDHLAAKMGVKDLDHAAKNIVNAAYKAMGHKGDATKGWAGKISGYAKENYAECVAEAVADHYCNGRKAAAESKAIMKELRRIQRTKK